MSPVPEPVSSILFKPPIQSACFWHLLHRFVLNTFRLLLPPKRVTLGHGQGCHLGTTDFLILFGQSRFLTSVKPGEPCQSANHLLRRDYKKIDLKDLPCWKHVDWFSPFLVRETAMLVYANSIKVNPINFPDVSGH